MQQGTAPPGRLPPTQEEIYDIVMKHEPDAAWQGLLLNVASKLSQIELKLMGKMTEEAILAALRAQTPDGAGAGVGTATGEGVGQEVGRQARHGAGGNKAEFGRDGTDSSGDLVKEMMVGLGPLPDLPSDADGLAALLQDRSRIKIPVPASSMPMLQPYLNSDQLAVLKPVQGQHNAAALFSRLIQTKPRDLGGKGTATIAMQTLFGDTLDALGNPSGYDVLPDVRLNLPERGSGSIMAGLRPDMVIFHNSCTILLGEDKAPDKLKDAVEAIQRYAQGGLPSGQYGGIPGIPAYAAAGTRLQFLYMKSDGEVCAAGPILDRDTLVGRLNSLCAIIQCYRLMVAMTRRAPEPLHRTALWLDMVRQEGSVMLTPMGAVKQMYNFKAFARRHGVTQESVMEAYKAAATAAQQQKDQGLKPFLVAAHAGPHFSRNGLEVHTTPLGYSRRIKTEADARQLANSCVRAVSILHAAGVAHTDLRLRNTVWLDEDHCMIIDLEHCRKIGAPLPNDVPYLEGWDGQTLGRLPDGAPTFMPTSDLYQIGRLLQGLTLTAMQQPGPARDFVTMLLGKRSLKASDQPLTAEEALQHEWLQAQ